MCDLAITLLGKSSWYQRGEMDAESLMNVLEENDRMEKALTAENLDLHKLLEASQREREQLRARVEAAEKLVAEWRKDAGMDCYSGATCATFSWCADGLAIAIASPPAAPVQAEGEK